MRAMIGTGQYIRQLLCLRRRRHHQGVVAGGSFARAAGAGAADGEPHPAAGAAVQRAGGAVAGGDAAGGAAWRHHLTPALPLKGRGRREGAARAAWPFPRARGWVVRLLAPVTGQPCVGALCLAWEAPEMKEFYAAAPQVGKILRPLADMIGAPVPEWLKLPKRVRERRIAPPSRRLHPGDGMRRGRR